MNNKQPQALASGYRRAVGKLNKIAELGITPDMSAEDQDALVKLLADKKALAEGKDWKKFVSGQRWYVEELVRFSGMTDEEMLDHEYQMSFPDVASEDEMLQSLGALAARIRPTEELAA